jgi:hypothetical protein
METLSYTIQEWCALRRYSRPYFYILRERGLAPDVIGEGKAQRITAKADLAWQRMMEAKAKRERKAS